MMQNFGSHLKGDLTEDDAEDEDEDEEDDRIRPTDSLLVIAYDIIRDRQAAIL